MQDLDLKHLLHAALDIPADWQIVSARFAGSRAKRAVRCVTVDLEPSSHFPRYCPTCGAPARIHDHLERRWRHLDIGVLQCHLVARVPRIRCPKEGRVRTVTPPWAAGARRHTVHLERRAADLLAGASISHVARHLGLSRDELAIVGRRAQAEPS